MPFLPMRAPGGADADALLREADRALYRAKAAGRATVSISLESPL